MMTEHTYDTLTWVDIKSPTKKEVRVLMDRFNVHPRVAEELLNPTQKPKLDIYDDFVYLILHFPALKHTHTSGRDQEVDFIIGKTFLITTHYDTVDSLHKFAKEFEVSSVVAPDIPKQATHAGIIFYHMVLKLYHSLQHELDFIANSLMEIEDNVFAGQERRMVYDLSHMSRNLLDMEQTVEGHERSLKRLLGESDRLFEKMFVRELQDILHHYHTVYMRIKDLREFLQELRTTNDSLLSAKQNEVMKTLTILAFVTFPLSLIASIFGMNTRLLPLVGLPGDFWIVIGIMIFLTGIMFAYFKHNKWL